MKILLSLPSYFQRKQAHAPSASPSSFRYSALLSVIMLLAMLLPPQESQACVYYGLLGKFNRAVARYNNNPTLNNELTVCRYFKRITKKFKNAPVPPLPPGVACPCPPPGGGGPGGGGPAGGGGRGGAGGGAGFPGGGPIPFNVWVSNQLPSSCNVSWWIVPDPSNPPGFTLSKDSGMIAAGAFLPPAVFMDSFMVSISALASPGDSAFFDVFFVDSCSGFQYTDEFSSFAVVALDSLTVTPHNVVVAAMDSTPFSNTWEVTNHSSVTKTVNYSFLFQGDPGSLETLNDTAFKYFIKNAAMASKGAAGGSATVPANSSVDIIMDKIPTDVCDPEMIECCGIEIDGAPSCVWNPNDYNGSHSCMDFLELTGTSMGGTIGVQIDTFFFQINIPAAYPVTHIVDAIAQEILQLFDFQNNFLTQSVVDSNAIAIMAPPGVVVEVFSTDPGITIAPVACDTSLVGLEDDFAEEDFQLYPNPLQGHELHYTWPISEAVQVQLLDLGGRHLASWYSRPSQSSLQGSLSIQKDRIPPGMYLIRFTSASGVVRTRKLLIND